MKLLAGMFCEMSQTKIINREVLFSEQSRTKINSQKKKKKKQKTEDTKVNNCYYGFLLIGIGRD